MSLDEAISRVGQYLINPLILLLFAVALVYFLWGLFTFMTNLNDAEKNKEGKAQMFWGIVGLAIMSSAYGILNFVISTLLEIKSL